MAYIFKKLNNLTEQSQQAPSVLGAESGVSKGTETNAHESTFRNPTAVVEANAKETLGGVDTGLTESIRQQQQSMGESSEKYGKDLSKIAESNAYQGRPDLEGINDTAKFSRLSSLMNPEAINAQMSGITSNTANYRPDTAGVAAMSTQEGLTNQLKNQFNTTRGGARLDANIMRNSGEAGQQIRQNQETIGGFGVEQQNRLNAEKQQLANQQSEVARQSNLMQQEAANYQNELSALAEQQAQQQQQQYDKQRQAVLDQLIASQAQFRPQSNVLQSELANLYGQYLVDKGVGRANPTNISDLISPLEQAGILKAYSGNVSPESLISDRNSPSEWASKQFIKFDNPQYFVGGDKRQATQGVNPYLYYENLLPSLSSNMSSQFVNNLQMVDPNNPQYLESRTQYAPEEFLDPRYNKLAQLLGTNQRTNAGVQDTDITANQSAYQAAVQQDVANKIAALKAKINELGVEGLSSTANQSELAKILGNPIVAAQLPAGFALGPLAETGLFDTLSNGLTSSIGGALSW